MHTIKSLCWKMDKCAFAIHTARITYLQLAEFCMDDGEAAISPCDPTMNQTMPYHSRESFVCRR